MDPKDLVEVAKVAGPVAALYSPVVQRLLGPTADYLGEVMKSCTQRGAGNLARIMRHAISKVGERIHREESVPPRVLKSILLEGPFVEDELSAEYFGGVLASSRSGVPRDDRGATLLSLLGHLSAYQVRSHYVFYRLFKQMYDGTSKVVGEQVDRLTMKVFIPADVYRVALEIGPDENYGILAEHSIVGLARFDLIDPDVYAVAQQESLMLMWGAVPGDGAIVLPSSPGVELFLWAHGMGGVGVEQFLDASVQLEFCTSVEIREGACEAVF